MLSTEFERRHFVTPSVHLCLQHDGYDADSQVAVKQKLNKSVCSPGLYLSNFIRGVEVLAIEVDDRANA